MKIRLASPQDETEIRRLLSQDGYAWLRDLDWSAVYPFWLLVEEEKILAMIQMIQGRPVAHLEHLIVDESLPHIKRARAVRTLILSALQILRGAGAQVVAGGIPFKLKHYKKILLKRGGFIVSSGHLVATKI